MTNTYEPVEIDPHDRALLEKIGRLRVLAWSTVIPEAAQKTECWLDEFDLVARHWCIFHSGEPVAAARMSVHQRIAEVPDAELYPDIFAHPPPTPIASFNRLVTHPDFRGRGFGARLDNVRLSVSEVAGCQSCIVSVTVDSRRFKRLITLGFDPFGKPFRKPDEHFLAGVNTQVVLCHFDKRLTSPGALLLRLPEPESRTTP